MDEKEKTYSVGEERFNVITHALGILGGLAVGALFLYKVTTSRGDAIAVCCVVLYVFGMLSSYIFSTSYHACRQRSKAKRLLRKLDHTAIYWHIAGSYSPLTLIAMRDTGYWGWGIFFFCWLCAIVGTSLAFRTLKKNNKLETVCYVLMGLTIVAAMKPFYESVPLAAFLWIIGEGVAYITGAVLYSFHKVKYIHSVFHIFVLLGTMCHMLAVWEILTTFI